MKIALGIFLLFVFSVDAAVVNQTYTSLTQVADGKKLEESCYSTFMETPGQNMIIGGITILLIEDYYTRSMNPSASICLSHSTNSTASLLEKITAIVLKN